MWKGLTLGWKSPSVFQNDDVPHSAVKQTARKSLDHGIQGELGPLAEESDAEGLRSIL